jgi:hypothetical protein
MLDLYIQFGGLESLVLVLVSKNQIGAGRFDFQKQF